MRVPALLSTFLLLCTMVGLVTAQPGETAPSSGVYAINCRVEAIKDIPVPAREAGVLLSMEAREGLRVKAGDRLAQIADDKPQMQKEMAEAELRAAEIQAKNDIDIRLAKMAEALTKIDYKEALSARNKVENALSAFELRRREFQWKRTGLQQEQAGRDFEVAQINAEIARQKKNAAQNEIDRRRVEAPFSGMVEMTYHEVGEWVSPGEPILRLVQMDRLRVEGFVDRDAFAYYDLHGTPVTVEIEMSPGEVERFVSKIEYVSSNVTAHDKFRVWAEIENRTNKQGFYLVQPGVNATMTLNATTASRAQGERR